MRVEYRVIVKIDAEREHEPLERQERYMEHSIGQQLRLAITESFGLHILQLVSSNIGITPAILG